MHCSKYFIIFISVLLCIISNPHCKSPQKHRIFHFLKRFKRNSTFRALVNFPTKRINFLETSNCVHIVFGSLRSLFSFAFHSTLTVGCIVTVYIVNCLAVSVKLPEQWTRLSKSGSVHTSFSLYWRYDKHHRIYAQRA